MQAVKALPFDWQEHVLLLCSFRFGGLHMHTIHLLYITRNFGPRMHFKCNQSRALG